MSKHRPISIFALQTAEERERTERLAHALEECGPNEVRLAFGQMGLPAPTDAPSSSPERDDSGKEQKKAGLASWLQRHWQAAACVAVLAVLVGACLGYSSGWDDASDAATAAQEQAAAEAEEAAKLAAEPTADQKQREKNVKARYKALNIDMDSMDKVDPDEVGPITVDKVKVKPTTELKRIGKVDVSKGTSKVIDVPIVNQLDTSHGGRWLMSGCEVASLAMLLRHAGVKVTKEELQDAMPTVPLVDEHGLHGNPNKAFVGTMEGSNEGGVGYSVYHGPIAALAQSYLINRSFKVVDLTGQSFTVLLKELASGNPCWVITTSNMTPIMQAETWQTAEGEMIVNWALHSVVVTGYDDDHIYINDPYGYTQNVPYDRNEFEKAWKLMGSQAVCIVPTK